MSLFSGKKIKKDDEVKDEVKKDSAGKKPSFKKSFSHKEYFILKPHVTEKSSDVSAKGQYSFRVAKEANKPEIKKAIENIYEVKVDSVRIINMPSKKRKLGRTMGKKQGYKKAIVHLKEGYKIEIIPGGGEGKK